MVALAVLTLISLFAGNIYINYTGAARDLKAANNLYEEGRFLMERMIREIRQSGIDYEEYFNQNVLTGALGENYCLYHQEFYSPGLDGIIRTKDDESLGIRNPDNLHAAAIASPIQKNLFLINLYGDKRTILTRIEKEVNGQQIGKIGLTKLIGKDFGEDHIDGKNSYHDYKAHNVSCSLDAREGDGLVDTWLCDAEFPCNHEKEIVSITNPACDGYTDMILNEPKSEDHSFIDISPNAINVVDLKFIVTPEDDPWKAYKVNHTQIQPHITVQLTIEANPKLVNGLDKERLPRLTLTSTASTRNYDEIKSSCL